LERTSYNRWSYSKGFGSRSTDPLCRWSLDIGLLTNVIGSAILSKIDTKIVIAQLSENRDLAGFKAAEMA
jgi:hypothetical protein